MTLKVLWFILRMSRWSGSGISLNNPKTVEHTSAAAIQLWTFHHRLQYRRFVLDQIPQSKCSTGPHELCRISSIWYWFFRNWVNANFEARRLGVFLGFLDIHTAARGNVGTLAFAGILLDGNFQGSKAGRMWRTLVEMNSIRDIVRFHIRSITWACFSRNWFWNPGWYLQASSRWRRILRILWGDIVTSVRWIRSIDQCHAMVC
jgi:hypothetical protein